MTGKSSTKKFDITSSAEVTSKGLYADPLIYEVLHQPGTRGEAIHIERIARRHVGVGDGPMTFLEPASGTGRYLLALAERGHRGVGVDLSAAMVRFARRRAREQGQAARLSYIAAAMERFTLPRRWRGRVDAAFNPINSIRHLMDDASMLAHFDAVRAALRPGGVYVVGIELSNQRYAQPTEDVWRGRDRAAGLSVQQNVSYVPPGRGGRAEVVTSHLTVRDRHRDARRVRHFDDRYELRTYSRPQWMTLLKAAGWSLVAAYNGRGEAVKVASIGYRLQVLMTEPRG